VKKKKKAAEQIRSEQERANKIIQKAPIVKLPKENQEPEKTQEAQEPVEPQVIAYCCNEDTCKTDRREIKDTEERVEVKCSAKCLLLSHKTCWRSTKKFNVKIESELHPCPTPGCWGRVTQIRYLIGSKEAPKVLWDHIYMKKKDKEFKEQESETKKKTKGKIQKGKEVRTKIKEMDMKDTTNDVEIVIETVKSKTGKLAAITEKEKVDLKKSQDKPEKNDIKEKKDGKTRYEIRR